MAVTSTVKLNKKSIPNTGADDGYGEGLRVDAGLPTASLAGNAIKPARQAVLNRSLGSLKFAIPF
jgi:hypothetical protein